jgi:hypothetical protein
MALSGRKVVAFWQKKRKQDSSDDKDSVEPATSKNAKLSVVALNPYRLISEQQPMDTICPETAWVASETVDTMGRILDEVDFDQCDFELYSSSKSAFGNIGLLVVIGME